MYDDHERNAPLVSLALLTKELHTHAEQFLQIHKDVLALLSRTLKHHTNLEKMKRMFFDMKMYEETETTSFAITNVQQMFLKPQVQHTYYLYFYSQFCFLIERERGYISTMLRLLETHREAVALIKMHKELFEAQSLLDVIQGTLIKVVSLLAGQARVRDGEVTLLSRIGALHMKENDTTLCLKELKPDQEITLEKMKYLVLLLKELAFHVYNIQAMMTRVFEKTTYVL